MLFCADPVAQRALNFMRNNLTTHLNIAELAAQTGVSKRTLESRLRERLQASPTNT